MTLPLYRLLAFPPDESSDAVVVKAFRLFFHGRINLCGWNRVRCLNCELTTGKTDAKTSLELNGETRGYTCFKCGIRGQLGNSDFASIISRVGSVLESTLKSAQLDVEQPVGYEPAFGPVAHQSASWVRRFLCGPRYTSPFGIPAREMCPIACEEAGVVFVPDPISTQFKLSNRAIFPVGIAKDNKFVGWVGRAVNTSVVPYLNAKNMHRDICFNQAAIYVETHIPLLVVEGVFDALRFWPNAVALLGKPSAYDKPDSPALALLKQTKRPLIVMLDQDASAVAKQFSQTLAAYTNQPVSYFELKQDKDPDLFGLRLGHKVVPGSVILSQLK